MGLLKMGLSEEEAVLIVAVVLAAGGGSRYDGPTHKLLAPWDGVPVVRRAVDAALAAAVGPVVVVTGAVDLADVLPADVTSVHNPDWRDGQASSLRAGIAAAVELGADAVVVGFGDMPLVPPIAWRTVAHADADLVTASYAGERSPPVRLARPVWAELPTTGDDGARVLMRRHPERVVQVEVPGSPADVDRVGDLERSGGAEPDDARDPDAGGGSVGR